MFLTLNSRKRLPAFAGSGWQIIFLQGVKNIPVP
jgi:hypothetical protein